MSILLGLIIYLVQGLVLYDGHSLFAGRMNVAQVKTKIIVCTYFIYKHLDFMLDLSGQLRRYQYNYQIPG